MSPRKIALDFCRDVIFKGKFHMKIVKKFEKSDSFKEQHGSKTTQLSLVPLWASEHINNQLFENFNSFALFLQKLGNKKCPKMVKLDHVSKCAGIAGIALWKNAAGLTLIEWSWFLHNLRNLSGTVSGEQDDLYSLIPLLIFHRVHFHKKI